MNRVYIAGPYSGGKWGTNVSNAIEAAEAIHQAGFYPFIPHTMTSLWSVQYEKDHQEWLEMDFRWVDVCDYLVRIPGESDGADREVEYALDNDIPVYFGVEKFLEVHD